MDYYVFSYYKGKERKTYRLYFWLTPLRWVIEKIGMPTLRRMGAYCFMLEHGGHETSYWPKGMTRPRDEYHFNDNIPSSGAIFCDGEPSGGVRCRSILGPRVDPEEKGLIIESQRTNLLRDTLQYMDQP